MVNEMMAEIVPKANASLSDVLGHPVEVEVAWGSILHAGRSKSSLATDTPPPPLATENQPENTDGGTPTSISVLSGRQPATFYAC